MVEEDEGILGEEVVRDGCWMTHPVHRRQLEAGRRGRLSRRPHPCVTRNPSEFVPAVAAAAVVPALAPAPASAAAAAAILGAASAAAAIPAIPAAAPEAAPDPVVPWFRRVMNLFGGAWPR